MNEGIVFGEYYLLGRLAVGGMAEVFLGKSLSPGTDQLLAIKKILPSLSWDPNFVSMFIDEARIASGLSHPNICHVTDHGQHDDQLFIVMEFIHGKDLRVLKRRAHKRGEHIPSRIIAHVVATIAGALDYAHHATSASGRPLNIVHRDVSPHNILVSYDGVPKLIDFGVAKAKRRLAETRVGVVKGKFAYMSPEQVTGKEIDARADIFALGVVLYELLTGRMPFLGSSDHSTLKRIARAQYVPPLELNPTIPARLCTVIETALQRDPAARFATASEMATELHRHLADDREITDTVVSSYLRRLFRDDYIREMARIKAFCDASAPAAVIDAAASASADDDPQRRDTEEHTETTTVSPSQFLAAGYDDGPPSSENPLDDEPAETTPTPRRFRIDTGEVNLAVATLAPDAVDGGEQNPTEREALTSLEGEPTPVDPRNFGAAPVEESLHEKTEEFYFTREMLEQESAQEVEHFATNDQEVEPSDFAGKTPVVLERPTDLDGLPAVSEEGAPRATANEERALVDSTRDAAFQAAAPVRPSADDDSHADDFEINRDELAETVRVDALAETVRVDALAESVRVVEQPPPPPRRGLFTGREIAILLLVAALGAALVAGVYYYASTMSLHAPEPPPIDTPAF